MGETWTCPDCGKVYDLEKAKDFDYAFSMSRHRGSSSCKDSQLQQAKEQVERLGRAIEAMVDDMRKVRDWLDHGGSPVDALSRLDAAALAGLDQLDKTHK